MLMLSTNINIKMMLMLVLVFWLLRVASPRSILLAFASCTGSCRSHQSKALSCSCSDGSPLLLQRYNPRCSSPSFASQNTCQAPWTARGFELLCSGRPRCPRRGCSASRCPARPCYKDTAHHCHACLRRSNRSEQKSCLLGNSSQGCNGELLCSHLCNPCCG